MKKKCCLSFGKCRKKFWLLILVAFIIDVLLIVLLYYFSSSTSIDISYYSSINMLPFLFFENLCQSFMFIPHLIHKKLNASKTSSSKLIKAPTNLIFNRGNVTFSFREKIYFIFFLLLKLFTEIFYITYLHYIISNASLTNELTYFFQFELIFLFLISKLFYNIKYYKHQYISIIILTIFDLFFFVFKFYTQIAHNFFLHLHCHIIYSFLKSTVTVYIKGLMEHKYISPYKACFQFGFYNLIIVTIVYIIASFFPCEGYLCLEEYNEKTYFGNILLIFNVNIFIMLLFFTLKAIVLVLNYVIINEFSVCHSFLLIQITQIIENAIILSLDFGSSDKTYDILLAFIFVFFALNIFFILLFLEIIEINCCNINYNTKKNIAERATIDVEMEFEELNVDNNSQAPLYDDN